MHPACCRTPHSPVLPPPRSSMGGGAASGSLAGAASGRPRGDPEKRLQERMHELAGVLRDVAKPEEGELGCDVWLSA